MKMYIQMRLSQYQFVKNQKIHLKRGGFLKAIAGN
jgi:hypothetical protein